MLLVVNLVLAIDLLPDGFLTFDDLATNFLCPRDGFAPDALLFFCPEVVFGTLIQYASI